jgi:hypothetical protein
MAAAGADGPLLVENPVESELAPNRALGEFVKKVANRTLGKGVEFTTRPSDDADRPLAGLRERAGALGDGPQRGVIVGGDRLKRGRPFGR